MGHKWNFGIFNEEKTKHGIMSSSQKHQKQAEAGKNGNEVQILCFLERESTFSLGFRSIGPSVFDAARSKVALRDEDYAWTPIWWSSDNAKR